MFPAVNSEAASADAPSAATAPVHTSPPSADHGVDQNGHQANGVNSIISYIEKNPLVATAAALALGAAMVMVVRSRTATNNGLDRRAMRAARSLERKFAKELRSAKESDIAGQLGKIGDSLGSAVGKVDLHQLVELGRTYVEAARNRLKV